MYNYKNLYLLPSRQSSNYTTAFDTQMKAVLQYRVSDRIGILKLSTKLIL